MRLSIPEPDRRLSLPALLLVLALAGQAHADGAVRYPANPARDAERIYLSDDGVHAYRHDDLAPSWSALPGVATLEPVPAGDLLLVGSASGLHALDVDDGRIVWQRWTGRRVFSPAVFGNTAYVGDAEGALHALTLPDGDVLWRNELPGWVYPPAVLGTTLYTGGRDGTVWALDAETGSLRWARSLGQELVYRVVADSGSTLVATTFAGEAVALAADDGRVLWRRQLDSPALGALPADALVLLATLSGSLSAVDIETGDARWRQPLPGPVRVPPVTTSRCVLVRDESGHLTTFLIADGTQVGRVAIDHASRGAPFRHAGKPHIFVADSGKDSPPRPVVLDEPMQSMESGWCD